MRTVEIAKRFYTKKKEKLNSIQITYMMKKNELLLKSIFERYSLAGVTSMGVLWGHGHLTFLLSQKKNKKKQEIEK